MLPLSLRFFIVSSSNLMEIFLVGNLNIENNVNDKDILRAIKYANDCATKVVQQKGVNTINDV